MTNVNNNSRKLSNKRCWKYFGGFRKRRKKKQTACRYALIASLNSKDFRFRLNKRVFEVDCAVNRFCDDQTKNFNHCKKVKIWILVFNLFPSMKIKFLEVCLKVLIFKTNFTSKEEITIIYFSVFNSLG